MPKEETARVIFSFANSNTFTIPPIRETLLKFIVEGLWLDPFANNMNIKEDLPDEVNYVTNDLNPKFNTTYNEPQEIFLARHVGKNVMGIVVDPPYSISKTKRLYDSIGIIPDGWKGHDLYHTARKYARMIRPLYYIQLGWNSNGPGKKLFQKIDHLLVPHGSSRNDTIMTVWKLKKP